MVPHGTDQCLYGSSWYRPMSLWFLMVQNSVFMVPLPPQNVSESFFWEKNSICMLRLSIQKA
jgi:hypothetical protein